MLKRISFITLFLLAASHFAVAQTADPQDMDAEFGINPSPTPTVTAPAPTPEAVAPAPAPASTPAPAVVKAPAPAKVAKAAPNPFLPASVLTTTPAPVPTPAPTPAPVAKAAPAKATSASTDDGEGEAVTVYHYAYVPDESLDHEPEYSKITQAGHPGIFFMSFMGQAVFYKGGNSGTPGFEIEPGLQFMIFKYLGFAVALNAAYRRGFVSGDTFYPLGADIQLRARLLPWLYPYFDGGFECVKTNSGWEHPSKLFGGGFMIRMGYADTKAEYSMYKAARITRIMLVLGLDHISSASASAAVMPSANVFKIGMSFEF
jgi:hypothetical protein